MQVHANRWDASSSAWGNKLMSLWSHSLSYLKVHLIKTNIRWHLEKDKKENPSNDRLVSITSVSGKVIRQSLLKAISKNMQDQKVAGRTQHLTYKGQILPDVMRWLLWWLGENQWKLFVLTLTRLSSQSPIIYLESSCGVVPSPGGKQLLMAVLECQYKSTAHVTWFVFCTYFLRHCKSELV